MGLFGGMIEVIEIDGRRVSLFGDYAVTLLEADGDGSAVCAMLAAGLVCDPIANRVEAPCLGRNIAGAANALACAN